MSAILKFDFQRKEQLRFSEVNYLTTQKRPNFACGNYIFPKTRGNKNKPWTHSTPLKCIRGPLGPNISFFAPPVKTRKDFSPSFFCNSLNISNT